MPLAITWTQIADSRLLHLRALGQPWHTVASELRVGRNAAIERARRLGLQPITRIQPPPRAPAERIDRPALPPGPPSLVAGHHRRHLLGGRGIPLPCVPMTGMPPVRLNRTITVPAEFDIRRTRAKPLPPRKPPPRPLDAETVIARLEEAGRTLLSLPQSGNASEHRRTRHHFVTEALGPQIGSPLPAPEAARLTRMDQALAWIPLIPKERLMLRRIVGCRSLVGPVTGRHLFSWRRLARLLGADHKAIQRWHATGIDLIVTTLKRDAAIVQSWDTLR